ncbi:MAG: hypothetical protein LW832_04830 [Parachlamydia sp.]|jgi:hypothetical protein|nr:hypothetical protein [Parachlamydia sp.]
MNIFNNAFKIINTYVWGESLNEKEIEQKIVDFFTTLPPQIYHETLSKCPIAPRKFYVCFSQSDSWAKYRSIFSQLKKNTLDAKDENIVCFWNSLIHKIFKIGTDEKISWDRKKPMLENIYTIANSKIIADFNDCKFNRNVDPKVRQAILNLSHDWQKLWLIKDWENISLEESNKINLKIYECTSENKNLDLKKYVNYSSKCIVQVEEANLKVNPKKLNTHIYIPYYPSKISIVKEQYGPASPYLAVNTEEQWEAVQSGYTSMAHQLGELVTNAIKKVNTLLPLNIPKENDHVVETIQLQ